MNKLKTFSKKLMKNNQGQGMVEYILLLVAVVAIVAVAKPYIVQYVEGTMLQDLTSKISGAMAD